MAATWLHGVNVITLPIMQILSYILSACALLATVTAVISLAVMNYVLGGVDRNTKLSDCRSRAIERFLPIKEEYISKLPPKIARPLRVAQFVYEASSCALLVCILFAFIIKQIST